MPAIKMTFNHVDISKSSVCFTWDDNSIAHQRLIAPQFLKHGFRCTFYINPGEAGFEETYLPGYKSLSENSFEIGSHGFYHQDFSGLSNNEFAHELKRSASSIRNYFGIYPATFAFPYHAFHGEMLQTARMFYLETRNTLENSKRFGIRTGSTLDDMLLSVRECVSNKHSLVFSGHSAIPDTDESGEGTGHEPIPLHNLIALLGHLQTLRDSAEVLTFEQAALKQYIINHCEISGSSYIISQEQADWLNSFRIGAERLSRLI